MNEKDERRAEIGRLNRAIESLCGIYARVAQRLGVHRSLVSRVARGERTSEKVEQELISEYRRVKATEIVVD